MKTTGRSLFAILGVLLLSPSLAQAHFVKNDPLSLHHGFMHSHGVAGLLAVVAVGAIVIVGRRFSSQR